jgi:hypothetical protein
MTDMLAGKVAIITGAARGLGAAYAKAFAAEGAAVCVSDVLDPAATANDIETSGGSAIGLKADVTDTDACEALVARTRDAFGGVDILVNNAALFVDTAPEFPRNRIGGMGQGDGGQCARQFQLRQGGGAGHAGTRRRIDHQHIVEHRAQGDSVYLALCHVQGRHYRHDQGDGARGGWR